MRATLLSKVLGENPSLTLQLLVASVLVLCQHNFSLCLGLHMAFFSVSKCLSPFPCKDTYGWIRDHPESKMILLVRSLVNYIYKDPISKPHSLRF